MRHPIQRQLSAIRRRVHALLGIYSLCRVLSAVIVTVAVLGLCDYLIHIQDRGLRIICSLTVVAVFVWTLIRYVGAALAGRFQELDIAQRIERRFPQLNDRLASTVQFLREPEDNQFAGSPALRRAVVSQTTAEVERLRLRDCIDPRVVWRAAAIAGVLSVVAAGIVWMNPSAARIALIRLADPLGEAAWPQYSHLAFRDTIRRIGLGQAFEVEVVDSRGASLPERAWIEYQYPGDEKDRVDQQPMQLVAGRFLARRENVARPFAYRAVGGDDYTMDWVQLEVVEPPAIESLSVTLHYPEYTGWQPAEVEPHLRAIEGTRVEISAQTTKQLRQATLHLDQETEIPLALEDDGFGFHLAPDADQPFIVQKTGSYWFSLVEATELETEGEDKLVGGTQTRYQIRAIADLPPTVVVEEPQGNLFVTADAVVPLAISAKDDLALKSVGLHYARSDRSEEGEFVVPLFEGPESVVPPEQDEPAGEQLEGDSRMIEHRWNLAALELPPATQITFQAVADDYQPKSGQSPSRRLTVITPDELQERLTERQSFILSELGRVLKLQRQARTQTESVEIQVGKVGRIDKQDVDHLQGAELTQRQVERALSDPSEGVNSHIKGLLADLENNRIDSPDMKRRMNDLAERIEEITTERLPPISRDLTASLKGAQSQESGNSVDDALRGSLENAGKQQDAVIASLEQMLDDLSEWENFRQFYREVAGVRHDQEEIEQETADLALETLSKELADLTPQQQADLNKAARRQQELARRFDKMQERMEQIGTRLEESDPLVADALADAVHQARQQALSGQMRRSGENLEKNQVGQAAGRQKEIMKQLDEMLDILANRREYELDRLVKKLREAEAQMQQMRERQDGLQKKMAAAANDPDEEHRRRELERLSKQQKQLADETERFARRLERLQAEDAARSTAGSAAKMGQANQQGSQGDAGGAAGQAAQAKKDLDEAQQQLAQRRRQAEIDLAAERLAKIEDSLVSLCDRQQGVIDETLRLEKLRLEEGRLSRGQTLSVKAVGGEQRTLLDETNLLTEKLSAAEVFKLALDRAADEMGRASNLLDRAKTDIPTQTAEENALRRLSQLLAALKTDEADGEGGEQEGGQGGSQGQSPAATDGIPDIAQLKLLKLMQQEIHGRTALLEERFSRRDDVSAEERQEYAALGEEQGALADLIRNLSQPTDEPPEDDPDKLPDLLPEDDPSPDLDLFPDENPSPGDNSSPPEDDSATTPQGLEVQP